MRGAGHIHGVIWLDMDKRFPNGIDEKEVKAAEEKTDRLNEKELEFLNTLPETDPYDGYVEEAVNRSHNNGGFYKRHYYRNTPRSNNTPSFH